MKLVISGRRDYLLWLSRHLAREHPKTRGRIGRKGFVGDIMTILIACFVIGIVILCMVVVVKTFNGAFQTIPTDAGVLSATNDSANRFPGAMDWLSMFALFGLPLVSATLIYFMDFSSIFLWIVVILSFLFVLFGAALSVGWNAIINTPLLSAYVSEIPMTAWVLNNYALYALFVVMIVVAAMFFKHRSGVTA